MKRSLLLADMNISPKTIDALQRNGWDIIRVSQELPVEASDDEVLEFALNSGRALITQDLDFSALLAIRGYGRPSLITLRLVAADPETVTRRLLTVLPGLEAIIAKGSIIVVDDVKVRVRTLPIG